MAQTFLGNLTTVWINTDTTNVDPNARTFVQVENLSGFPSFSESTSVSTVETYNSTYTSKVAGDSSYGDMTIEVNYVPGENAVLDSVVDSQQLVQVKVEMLDEGSNDTTVNYVLYNGYLSSVSDTSGMDEVVTRSYVFTPETQLSAGILDESVVELYRGDWGVGSNGNEFPSYQGRDGNSFVKIAAANAPTGVDMLGITNLDGSNGTQLVMSKTGTPVLNIRNFSTASNGAWYKIYTSADKPTLTELGAAAATDLSNYVPITRTVNGKALTANITLMAADISDVYSKTYIDSNVVPKVFQLNGHALSGTALNLVAADILDVYSQTQVNNTFVAKTVTVNGLPLSGNITLTAAQLTDMASLAYSNSTYVPKTFLINNKPLSGTNIQLVAADISDVYSRTESNGLFALRITTINGYALNSNVTLNYNDVGTYSKAQIDAKDAALQANIDTKVTITQDLLTINNVEDTLELDMSDGKRVFKATLTAPVTQLSVINASGSNLNSQTITMLLTQGTGANKISWPSNVKWSYGREPVLTFTKDAIDVIQFLSVDGGSTWYGSLLMADLQE
ncbi:phage tail protein [Enterobacter ludwigii]